MNIRCDLHIHTALSPCGDSDMTPNNIANMAILNGLQIIAITDHNSSKNAGAVMECAKDKPLLVVPGMELETSEEVHFICLFPSLLAAQEFEAWLSPYRPAVQNRPEIFGEQVILNELDERVGTERHLLLTASTCSIYDAVPVLQEKGAIVIPAHVDRSSYSILSNLGFLPPDLSFPTIEISRRSKKEKIAAQYPFLAAHKLITGSDAHYLADLYEDENCLPLAEISIDCLLAYLQGKE